MREIYLYWKNQNKRDGWILKTIFYKRGIEYFRNSGKFFLEPYTKDFGRITHFLGNDLATVLSATFCSELRSWQLILNTKVTKK